MSEEAELKKRPDFVGGVRVKAPEDYDFSNEGISFFDLGRDFSQYSKEYKLRTDAVWEKIQLKDWYRLVNKVTICSTQPFFYNKKEKKYLITEPDDNYSISFEPWGFEDNEVFDYAGFTPTGMTTSFQVSLGAKQRVESTFNSFYSMPDYYIMCAMRFEKWFKCDEVYFEDRNTAFDRNPDKGMRNMKAHDFYPCYKEWYETSYACADNILKYLVELSYAKRSTNFFQEDTSSVEIRAYPTIFDSPSNPERITYTY